MTQPHHLANIASHGGVPEISVETRAYTMHKGGLGERSIALVLCGDDTDQSLAKVRKLIEQGRAKSFGAH